MKTGNHSKSKTPRRDMWVKKGNKIRTIIIHDVCSVCDAEIQAHIIAGLPHWDKRQVKNICPNCGHTLGVLITQKKYEKKP